MWGVKVWFCIFVTLVLDGVKWSTACPGCFTPRKEPQYSLNRRLGGLSRVSLDILENNLLPLPGMKTWIIQPIS
jgi:hypothetical protein